MVLGGSENGVARRRHFRTDSSSVIQPVTPKRRDRASRDSSVFRPTAPGASRDSYGTLPLPRIPGLSRFEQWIEAPTTYAAASACLEFWAPPQGAPLSKASVCNDRGPHGRTRRIAVVKKRTMKARSDQTLVHDLRELVAAPDRRVPRVEREGAVGQETA
jgi:hypothetical protein